MRKWSGMFVGLAVITTAIILTYWKISPVPLETGIGVYAALLSAFGLGYVCGMADEAGE